MKHNTLNLKDHLKAANFLPFPMWWLDLGWVQDAHPATLSLPLFNRRQQKNQMKKLMRTGRSLTHYSHRPNLGKINLISCQAKET